MAENAGCPFLSPLFAFLSALDLSLYLPSLFHHIALANLTSFSRPRLSANTKRYSGFEFIFEFFVNFEFIFEFFAVSSFLSMVDEFNNNSTVLIEFLCGFNKYPILAFAQYQIAPILSNWGNIVCLQYSRRYICRNIGNSHSRRKIV